MLPLVTPKKVVFFQNYSPTAVLAELEKACGRKVPNNPKLQRYDEKWNDWVDVTIPELANGMKIQILPATNTQSDFDTSSLSSNSQQTHDHDPGSDSTILLEGSSSCTDEDLDSVFDLPSTQFPSYTFTVPKMMMDGTTDSSSGSGDVVPSTSAMQVDISHKQNVREVTENNSSKEGQQTAELPSRLRFETMPSNLTKKLSGGHFPNESERRQIISCVYNEMAGYVMYPTSEQYTKVAASLVKEYPILAQGTLSTTPYHYWKTRLIDKYRNERRHLGKPLKRQINLSTGPCPTKKQPSNGEDDASLKRHHKWLQDEFKKRDRDDEKVSMIMGITFHKRREEIISNPQKLTVWKTSYPFLFNSKELCLEFERITGRKCILKEAVLKYVKVVEHADEAILSSFQQKSRNISESNDLNDLRCVAILVSIPSFLKERTEHLLVLENDTGTDAVGSKPAGPEPLLIGHGEDFFNLQSLCLKVENEVVCSSSTVVEGFQCLMAAYYAFNITFPNRSKNMLKFLDLLLGLKCKRLPRTVYSFLAKYEDF